VRPQVAVLLAGLTPLASAAASDALQFPAIAPGVAQEGAASAPAENAQPPAPAAPAGLFPNPRATFLISNEPAHSDPEILWPGFLSGLRGFEHFYEPIGNPLYFESPFNKTEATFLYINHAFPDTSQLGGGDVNIYALQLRVALTERLGFIATKDGYSDLNAGILPHDEGWNDLAVGLKYAFYVDREEDFVATAGMRWELSNGDLEVLQGDAQELSPFLSIAKGWDRLHFLGNVTARLPMDHNRGNYILSWDAHLDYEIAPEVLPGFAPVLELHGLHYLSDGNYLPLNVGGYDYTNLGSSDVAGDFSLTTGIGFAWKLTPHLSLGSTWEFPLTDKSKDITDNRVTAHLKLSW
jgi:hypothetical protein